MKARDSLVGVLALTVGACAAPPPAAIPPVLDLAGHACVPGPDLAGAIAIPDLDAKPIELPIEGPCVEPAGASRRNAVVLRLPIHGETYLVDVTTHR